MSSEELLQSANSEDYSGEVRKCIEEMRRQCAMLNSDLGKIGVEKRRMESEVRSLTSKLAQISQEQVMKMQFKLELERTIDETEGVYARLVERQDLHQTILNASRKAQNNYQHNHRRSYSRNNYYTPENIQRQSNSGNNPSSPETMQLVGPVNPISKKEKPALS